MELNHLTAGIAFDKHGKHTFSELKSLGAIGFLHPLRSLAHPFLHFLEECIVILSLKLVFLLLLLTIFMSLVVSFLIHQDLVPYFAIHVCQ